MSTETDRPETPDTAPPTPDPTATLAAWRAAAESGDVWTDCVLSIPGDHGIDHPDVEAALDTAQAAIERRTGHDVLVSSERSGGDGETFYSVRAQRDALLSAVEAVLALHRRNRPEDGMCQGYTLGGYGYLDAWCVECSEQSGREYGTAWPCPTAAALAERLGGEGQ